MVRFASSGVHNLGVIGQKIEKHQALAVDLRNNAPRTLDRGGRMAQADRVEQ
jgi:hypothetical protein